MATRGNKLAPVAVLEARGTKRKDRARESVVTDKVKPIVRPPWLKGRARKIWDEKVAKYKERGQNVSGCLETLAQYCSVEASLIDDYWRHQLTPPVSLVNAHRVYAGEFYDTPASQVQRKKPAAGGDFENNGSKS